VPPYYYRRTKDRFYALSEGGVVLGPTVNPSYQRGFFKLQPGDGVILVTDGVLEAANEAGEEFGEARVQAFVREHCDSYSAGEMVDRLLDAARDHAASGIFLDDATAVYCRRVE
jgi:sigma-B regulation protein RsbU (phosphoserine phosphatase)